MKTLVILMMSLILNLETAHAGTVNPKTILSHIDKMVMLECFDESDGQHYIGSLGTADKIWCDPVNRQLLKVRDGKCIFLAAKKHPPCTDTTVFVNEVPCDNCMPKNIIPLPAVKPK